MKNRVYFFRPLRSLAAVVAALIFFICVLLPPVLGLITRQIIADRAQALQGAIQESLLSDLNVQSLHTESIRSGWFSSEILVSASGTVFSGDGLSPTTRTGILHVDHGPVIWHLSDSLLALANMQLLPAADVADPTQHFSASAIATLSPALAIQLHAIAGIHASGGEHWLELQSTSPLLPMVGKPARQLWLDLDVNALRAAGLGEQLTQWQQTRNGRLSNNRLLFNIGSQ